MIGHEHDRGDEVDDHDDDNDVRDRGAPARSMWTRLCGWLVVGAGVAVCLTFMMALGAGRVGPDRFVVVVTDPTPRAEPTPVLAMVVGPASVVPFSGRINGQRVGPAIDVAVVDVATADGIVIDGEADIGGAAVPVALSIAAAELRAHKPLGQMLSASTTSTLAVPSRGPAIFPVDGLVPARGPADVVVVDDGALEVVTVDAVRDGRLPDGRLLAVDRRPVAASLRSDDEAVSLVVMARRESPVLVTLSIGGRLVVLQHARVRAHEQLTIVEPSSTFRRGDVVVAAVSTSVVPGVTAEHELQLVDRVGGVRDEDLLRIEPRAAMHLDNPRVRRALTRRLVVHDGAPRPVSPSSSEQRARQQLASTQEADVAQGRFRAAAVGLVLALCGLGLAWRVRMMSLVSAVVVVGAVVWGLDQLLVATRS